MRAGSFLMLGLMLTFVLVFAYWLRTPHQLASRWSAVDRGLEQIDQTGDVAAR